MNWNNSSHPGLYLTQSSSSVSIKVFMCSNLPVHGSMTVVVPCKSPHSAFHSSAYPNSISADISDIIRKKGCLVIFFLSIKPVSENASSCFILVTFPEATDWQFEIKMRGWMDTRSVQQGNSYA